jgi:WD40 repeat protein
LFKVSGSQATWNTNGSRLLTFGGDGGMAQMWDAAAGQKLFDLTGHTDWVIQASWNASGSRILTVDSSHMARVWNAQTGQELLKLAPLQQIGFMTIRPVGTPTAAVS